MPNPRPEAPRPRRRARRATLAAALATLLAGPLLAGCGVDGGEPASYPFGTSTAEVVRGVERTLARRAASFREDDEATFRRTLASTDPAFVSSELRRFDDVTDLPLGVLRYELDPATLTTTDRGVEATAMLVMQLEGYDARPVSSPRRYAFERSARNPSRWLVAGAVPPPGGDAGDGDGSGEALQPWDLTDVEVVEGDGVLAVLDAGSAVRADELVREVEDAVAAVAPLVPVPWERRVVVYALSGTEVLASIDDLPGGDPDLVDAVAFPVRSRPGGPLAATRFVLHPRMLDRPAAERDRLVRHELVHVALGERDDAVPVWLSEGLAEWVSTRPLPPAERLIARAALDAARAGVDDLPADEEFGGDPTGAQYGLSWFACEHVAAVYGEDAPWRLLEAMAERGDATPDDVLREVLGIGSAELADASAERIVATFG